MYFGTFFSRPILLRVYVSRWVRDVSRALGCVLIKVNKKIITLFCSPNIVVGTGWEITVELGTVEGEVLQRDSMIGPHQYCVHPDRLALRPLPAGGELKARVDKTVWMELIALLDTRATYTSRPCTHIHT